MSRYGWDSGSRAMSPFGHLQHLPQISHQQIACRLCDQIFMSSRALINHLESHMTEGGAISTRKPEINFISHHREGNNTLPIDQFQPTNLALPTPPQDIRSSRYSPATPARTTYGSGGRFGVLSPQLQLAGSNYMFTVRQTVPPVRRPAKHRSTMKQLPRDFIKPYIDQLDKPIPETVELMESDDDEKNFDLTLKL